MNANDHISDSVESRPEVVRFDNVTKCFPPDVTALDEVSMVAYAGEVVVLLGLSGSGKSTLLRHVDGLHFPTSGNVRALDVDVESARSRTLRQLRRRIGFVFQQFHLVPGITVLENACTGALGRLTGPRLGLPTYPRAIREEALEQLDRVGLADRAFQRAGTLSGGQQQRVAIARAMLQRPEVLLADEPVASLDPESSHHVMELINRVAREEDLTVLCSLHQVDLALAWGDRIVGLHTGKVVMDTPVSDIDHTDAMSVYARVGAEAVVDAAAE